MEIIIFLVTGLVGGFVTGFLVGRRVAPAAPELFDEADIDADPRLEAARGAVQARIEKRLVRVMEKVQAEGRITNDGVEELFCISDRTAGNYLRLLTERGSLERKGVGRGTYYIPK
jgi:predicted HTH transcriptional regulator